MPRLKKNYTKREEQKGRCFLAVIYPDSESYDYKVILNRLPYFWDNYYYILHDKDVYLESDWDEFIAENGKEPDWLIGDKKKPHYHLIGYCSPTLLGRAAIKFGLPSNYIQLADKPLKDNVQYLIHIKEPWKYQYLHEEIITNDEEIEKKLAVKKDAEEKATILFDFICSTDVCSISELTQYALKNHCWDELRRGQHIYTQLIREKRESLIRSELRKRGEEINKSKEE